MEKAKIREGMWQLLEERRVARFPKPIKGRIPNFVGAERAATRLSELREFQRAKAVFCNPDSPQRGVREAVLKHGKSLMMASPRLRQDLLLLDPGAIPRRAFREASTIRGAFRWGRRVTPASMTLDLKVTGSVAVSLDGGRIGKGRGYSDLEYAILRELGSMDETTPVATTVHDLQVVPEIPMEKNDMPTDIIATPTRIIRALKREKPEGVLWDLVTEQMLRDIPMLNDLVKRRATSSSRPSKEAFLEDFA